MCLFWYTTRAEYVSDHKFLILSIDPYTTAPDHLVLKDSYLEQTRCHTISSETFRAVGLDICPKVGVFYKKTNTG